MNEYLTSVELAKLLRITEQTVRAWRLRGSGPRFVKLGSRVVYARADVDTWIGEQRRSSTSDGH